ncbi:transglycosylase domain-containing protein [Candidatus Korobacter versatilis]|uniref:transglycosylase domain-containing protein n=1 Tax=Candidatus Korobacter versatilis TaxID=658062 RepID=UPI00164FBB92|nr:PBP1A family penicillin-binding protein [Candidatus Koribacter versatilis]
MSASKGKSRSQASAEGWRRYEREIRLGVAAFIVVCIVFFSVFTYYYVKYQRIVDRRMSGQIFAPSAKIYARPVELDVGDRASVSEIAADLRRSGYSDDAKGTDFGRFELRHGGIEIYPGPQSYHSSDSATIYIADGKVSRIAGGNGGDLSAYELEPQLVTALFQGEDRSKRQIVKFNEIPKVMVDAVLAIEDRRFFQHGGVNYYRLAEAGITDVLHHHRGQGGSTLTMQLSRGFFLTPEKTMKRKFTEMLIAIELEQRFSKQQIFELYANQVPMGQRGSYGISGFGEAARAYFNKDIKNLTLPEAALLAGLIQRPSYLSPYRHPERALDRRNLVLDSMVETGTITRDEADKAKATPLKLAAPNVEASDAPYFVDMVKDFLGSKYGETDINENQYRIYTSIDPELQKAAAEAVEVGIKGVDEQVLKARTKKVKVGTGKNAKTDTEVKPGPEAQVALVAIDPHTGEVLALVGGRNYGMSQLNHAIAKRPTGSIFKPFVYAAAMNTAITGDPAQAVTPASLVDDSPTTFMYGDQIYEPRNYKAEYHGQVTARYALAMSLNNATVKLAEQVGYDNVANLAKNAGIVSVKATPAMALGAYDATPLEMAGAYTVFANGGVRLSPTLVKSVRTTKGDVVDNFQAESRNVLDPRVAAVLTDMLQGPVNYGTGYTVRQRGFTAPAAGKTGTSHDAWFAGYTSNLLCIVWVGFDDYSDIKLSGAVAAAPVWAEFMKRAQKISQYEDMKGFGQPSGVVSVELDKVTNDLATPSCPETYTASFVAGTEPKETCDQALGDHRGILSKIFGGSGQQTVLPPPTTNGPVNNMPPAQTTTSAQQQQQDQNKKKKGFFGKIAGFFKSDGSDGQQSQQQNQTDPNNNGSASPH